MRSQLKLGPPRLDAFLVSLAMLVIGPSWASAQSETRPPEPPAAPAPSALEVFAKSIFAERLVVTFTAADGASARSVVIVRSDPGSIDQATPRPQRLRLSLGRLEIMFTPGTALATYRGEPSSYFEASLADGLSPAAVRGILPRVPIPHIQWILGDDAQRASLHPFGLPTTLVSTDPDGTQHFTSEDGNLVVKPNPRTARPRRIELRAHDQSLLVLDITPMDSRDSGSWDLSMVDRRRVESLADLRVRSASPLVGQVLRDVGFTTFDLKNVTLAELVKPPASGVGLDAPHRARAFAFLVFMGGRDGTPIEPARLDVAAGRAALNGAVEALLAASPPMAIEQLGQFLVSALPLETLDVEALATSVAAMLADPEFASKVRAQAFHSSAAQWILKDQMSGCDSAIVVINAERAITYAAPLDGRAEEIDALTAELTAALGRTLGITPLTLTAPEVPPTDTPSAPQPASAPK